MNTLDILYTPLDTPEVPTTDMTKLLNWIEKNSSSQIIPNRRDASQDPTVPKSKYPWNIMYAKLRKVWQSDFDKEFPDLANFFSSAYGLNVEDINDVILLPVKNEFAGTGFWHSDRDDYGLRMYIENRETENFLLIRPTVEPYNTRPDFGLLENFEKTPLQDKTFSATLYSSNQTFFINNVRAVHAVNTVNPGSMRIAVLLWVEVTPETTSRINDLILRSAEKFKEHAILWPAT